MIWRAELGAARTCHHLPQLACWPRSVAMWAKTIPVHAAPGRKDRERDNPGCPQRQPAVSYKSSSGNICDAKVACPNLSSSPFNLYLT